MLFRSTSNPRLKTTLLQTNGHKKESPKTANSLREAHGYRDAEPKCTSGSDGRPKATFEGEEEGEKEKDSQNETGNQAGDDQKKLLRPACFTLCCVDATNPG